MRISTRRSRQTVPYKIYETHVQEEVMRILLAVHYYLPRHQAGH